MYMTFFVDSDADVMCLQDLGVGSNVTPAAVQKLFGDHGVWVAGERDNPRCSVGIVTHRRLVVGKVLRDKRTSRAVGVVLKGIGATRLLVVSVLMPTGLDQCPIDGADADLESGRVPSQGRMKRDEAECVRRVVNEWKAEYPAAIVMGTSKEFALAVAPWFLACRWIDKGEN